MAQDDRSLTGKRAIITGASSGVGKATAILFAAEGATVGLIARRANLVNDFAAGLGKAAMALPADVADDKAVASAIERFATAHGGIDIVVNAAGIDGPAPLKELTPEVWRRQLDVNLSGTFYVAREAGL